MTTVAFTLLVLLSALGGQSIRPVSGKIQVVDQETRRNPLPALSGRDFQIGRSENTNLFGIYLVTEPVDRRLTVGGTGDWSRVRLSESPLISADDIISYDFEEHSMRLRLEALARIPTPPVEGTPFVVVAHGQRIYLGVFTTAASSIPSAVPSIIATYGDYEITVGIEDGIVTGKFPRRALAHVLEWYQAHREELRQNWELAKARKPLRPIAPLE